MSFIGVINSFSVGTLVSALGSTFGKKRFLGCSFLTLSFSQIEYIRRSTVFLVSLLYFPSFDCHDNVDWTSNTVGTPSWIPRGFFPIQVPSIRPPVITSCFSSGLSPSLL